jgi:hypothetical protein
MSSEKTTSIGTPSALQVTVTRPCSALAVAVSSVRLRCTSAIDRMWLLTVSIRSAKSAFVRSFLVRSLSTTVKPPVLQRMPFAQTMLNSYVA